MKRVESVKGENIVVAKLESEEKKKEIMGKKKELKGR